MTPMSQWSLTDRGSTRNAWIAWAMFILIIMTIVAVSPDTRTVTPNYREAVNFWFAGQDIYGDVDHIHGFLYLPQGALVYGPIVPLPKVVGEPLGRLILVGFFIFGMWQLCRLEDGEKHGRLFAVLSLVSLPLVLANARNGQFNLAMGGAFMLAAASLGRGHWWRCTVWLVLAVAFKPIAVVMLLLVGVVWWRAMAWRLAVGMIVMLFMPFALQWPDFVLRQYALFFDKLATAGAPPMAEWYDINGIIENGLGLDLPKTVLTLIRAVAAVGTLALVWWGMRRFDRATAAMLCFVWAMIYLMLFNPRTEGPSYVLLMPAAGLVLGFVMVRNWPGSLPVIVAIALAAMVWNLSFQIFAGLDTLAGWMGGGAIDPKQYWARPLLVVLFAGYIKLAMWRTREMAESVGIEPQRHRDTESENR